MTEPRNNAPKTRGKPFARGNPGRPRGARHKVTLAVEALLEGEAEELTRAAIDKAKAGDTVALRLCLDRIAPARKDLPIKFDLPAIDDLSNAKDASAAILQAVADGEITPADAQAVMGLLVSHKSIVDATDFETRLAALEARNK